MQFREATWTKFARLEPVYDSRGYRTDLVISEHTRQNRHVTGTALCNKREKNEWVRVLVNNSS